MRRGIASLLLSPFPKLLIFIERGGIFIVTSQHVQHFVHLKFTPAAGKEAETRRGDVQTLRGD